MSLFSKNDLSKLSGRDPNAGNVSEWFRPSHNKDTGDDKKYTIRLLPQIDADGNPDPYPFHFERMHFFYGENYISGACPQTFGDECPACDIFFTLIHTPEIQENKGFKESLQNIAPDNRAYANVYDYMSESIRVWSVAYGARKKIDDLLADSSEYGVFLTDPEAGKDIILTMTPIGKNSMVKGVSSPQPEVSPLPLSDWKNNLHDLGAKAQTRKLSGEDIMEAVQDQLGDHFDPIIELYHKAKGNTTEEVGEAV